MSPGHLQTLESLHTVGVTTPMPVLTGAKPVPDDLEKIYHALSILENLAKFHLPPLQATHQVSDGLHYLKQSDSNHPISRNDVPKKKRLRGNESKRKLLQKHNLGTQKAKNKGRTDRRQGISSEGSSGGFRKFFDGLFGSKLFSKPPKPNQKETIWLESTVKFPGLSSSSSGNHYLPSSSSSSGYGKKKRHDSAGGSSSAAERAFSSSSSSRGPLSIPKKKKGGLFHCSIGRTDKNPYLAFTSAAASAVPMMIIAVALAGSPGVVTALTNGIAAVINALVPGRAGRFSHGTMARNANATVADDDDLLAELISKLKSPTNLAEDADWKNYLDPGRSVRDSFSLILWKLATNGFSRRSSCEDCRGYKARDLNNDVRSSDENDYVLRMLDDFVMAHKSGFVPKCTNNHICKVNKAAAFEGQPQSTLVPLVSFSAAAFFLGKPSTSGLGKLSSNMKEFLHAVWSGRSGKDCDEVFPDCSDAKKSSGLNMDSGGTTNSANIEQMDKFFENHERSEENDLFTERNDRPTGNIPKAKIPKRDSKLWTELW